MKDLQGKWALITGGSDGIGYGIARAFARAGANLIITARDEEKLAHTKAALEEYGVHIHTISADMSQGKSIEFMARKVKEDNISPHIIVNNAGIARFMAFEETEEELLDYHINLNVKAPYLLTQTFLHDLINNRGNVINVSSYFARRMLPDRPSTAYSLSKGALESLTKAMAYELGPRGVRVNAIAPGTVATPQVKKNLEYLDEAGRERFGAMIETIYPLRHLGEPGDVGEMALYLASERAKWITGGIFPVDGGLTTN